jgi:hypothetical protein
MLLAITDGDSGWLRLVMDSIHDGIGLFAPQPIALYETCLSFGLHIFAAHDCLRGSDQSVQMSRTFWDAGISTLIGSALTARRLSKMQRHRYIKRPRGFCDA